MHIEVRIVGKKRKYYLAHSIRRGKNVKKLRYFLGVNLSKKELNKKRKLGESVISERIKRYEIIMDPFYVSIDSKELQEIKSLYNTEKIGVVHLSENDWNNFTKIFTYDTNAIEGSTVTFTEVSGILEKDRWPEKRTKYEISETYGVSDAIKYIRKTKDHISLELIKELHKIVFKNSKEFAGKFRTKGIEVAVVDSFGNIVHRGAPATYIIKLLKELISWYKKNNKKYPALILAVVVHNHFETIHPFQDGNGRVGRLLLNNILIKNNLPPVNIGFNNRREYYSALQFYQNNKDIKPMVKLILKEYNILKRILNK